MIRFIFNLDGILASGSVLEMISKRFETKEAIDDIMKTAREDNIPFVESFIRCVHILGNFSVDAAGECISEEGKIFPEVMRFIKERKEACAIATEYIGSWVRGLLEPLLCPYYCSDALLENDKVKKLTFILKKENIIERYKNAGERVVFIGSSDNDMEAMRIADISIASGLSGRPAKSILSAADYLVFTEEALCRQLHQL